MNNEKSILNIIENMYLRDEKVYKQKTPVSEAHRSLFVFWSGKTTFGWNVLASSKSMRA